MDGVTAIAIFEKENDTKAINTKNRKRPSLSFVSDSKRSITNNIEGAKKPNHPVNTKQNAN